MTQDTDREELVKIFSNPHCESCHEDWDYDYSFRTESCCNRFMDDSIDRVVKYVTSQRKAAEIEGRIAERDGMQFFDDNGEETHKPYLQYRFIGDGLKLSWDDRTKELQAQKEITK